MTNKTQLELGQTLYEVTRSYSGKAELIEHTVTGISMFSSGEKYFSKNYDKTQSSFSNLKRYYYFSRLKAERVLAQLNAKFANRNKRLERATKLYAEFLEEQQDFMKSLIKKEVFVYGGKDELGVKQWIRTSIDGTNVFQNYKTGKCSIYISTVRGSGWYKLSKEGVNWKWYTEETDLLLEKERLEKALGVLIKKLEDAKMKSNKGE